MWSFPKYFLLRLVNLMHSISFVSYLGSNSMSKLIKSIKNHSGEYDQFTEFCACMCVCGPCGAHKPDKTCIIDIALTSHHASGDSGERVMRHGGPQLLWWWSLRASSQWWCALSWTLSHYACVKCVSYGVQAQRALSVWNLCWKLSLSLSLTYNCINEAWL